jgi:vacuolar protein sorting-associated protein 26
MTHPHHRSALIGHYQLMLESILNFGGTASVDINIDPNVRKKTALFFDKARNKIKLPVYTGDDDISGVVEVKLQGTKRLEHLGIRIELVGHLEMYTDKALSTDFMSMAKELEPAGALVDNKVYRFMFPKFEKAYETFYGSSGSVRYYLRVSITRNYNTRIVKEVDFAVQLPTPQLEEEGRTPIKLEVGIEECLLIDFEYNKSNYHLKDCIVGKVSFHLVRIKIKLMEIAIVRREIIGTGPSSTTENETLVRF